MVSPYLKRPLRSFEEVSQDARWQRDLPYGLDDEALINHALSKAVAEGQGPLAQIDQALTAILTKRPAMAPLEALELVNRIRRDRQQAGESLF